MRKRKQRTKSLAIFLATSICLCCISVSNVSASVVKAENDLQEKRSVEQATLPENIQSLIPEEKRGDLVVTASTDTDNAEMCTIRTENPETGEGTLFVHSSPIKYKDKNGDIHFIDTSMETISAKAKTNSGYAYRNAANSFTVEYGKTADIGINFDEAFTVVPVNNAPLERAETANASASAARPMSENGNGKLRYDGVFGADTHVEYVNTTNGIKETIILDRYTGTDRFDFIFRSKTHIPLLAEGGAYILVAPKDKPEEPEYRFLSLYAYDAYEPDGTASTFRHMNEDLYYELTSNTDGSFIISVVVPDDYLTHPDIVYPVTIDPSVQKVANNSNVHDTYVNEAAPTTQSYYNYDYIRFGSSNGKRMFGYIRYTELPSLPTKVIITSAYLKFTFRSGQNTSAASTNIRFWTLRVTTHQWNESTITWNNQPYGYDGKRNSFHYNGKYLDYVDADITDMARGWYSGTANYGMDFTYENEEYNDYNSVVSSEGDADRAPVLTINYETLRIGYTIQNNYKPPCAESSYNYSGFANYANGTQNAFGANTTYFSWVGSSSYSNDLKSDMLTGGIGYKNIEDVDMMFFIGHGYVAGKKYEGCGTPTYNSLHFGTTNAPAVHGEDKGMDPSANFTTYDARYFGYNSRVKWLITYTCNFLSLDDEAIYGMLQQGGRLILGFSSKMVINSDEGKVFAEKCLEGKTIQEAFFQAAGIYQESTLIHGNKLVSCRYYYDDTYPDGTKADTLTYQNDNVTRQKYYILVYNVDDVQIDE